MKAWFAKIWAPKKRRPWQLINQAQTKHDVGSYIIFGSTKNLNAFGPWHNHSTCSASLCSSKNSSSKHLKCKWNRDSFSCGHRFFCQTNQTNLWNMYCLAVQHPENQTPCRSLKAKLLQIQIHRAIEAKTAKQGSIKRNTNCDSTPTHVKIKMSVLAARILAAQNLTP